MNVKDQFANAENELKKGRVKAAVDAIKLILQNQSNTTESYQMHLPLQRRAFHIRVHRKTILPQ
mgnify:CR=1 FL=1